MHICRILSVFDSLWSAEGLEHTKNRLKIFTKTSLVVMKVCTSISSHMTTFLHPWRHYGETSEPEGHSLIKVMGGGGEGGTASRHTPFKIAIWSGHDISFFYTPERTRNPIFKWPQSEQMKKL